MGWVGSEDEEQYAPTIREDPYPFTPEGRLYQRIEHELALSIAVLKVGSLVLLKQAKHGR